MHGDYTSVPRLAGAAPPCVDPAGRSYAVIAVGAAARLVAERWLDKIHSPVWSCLVEGLDSGLVSSFEERLRAARIGWRLMLAGPEADVMRLRAQAIRAGALPVEIREYVTEANRRRVHCAHCRTVTEADAELGGTVVCEG
jgi:hypothetical protein